MKPGLDWVELSWEGLDWVGGTVGNESLKPGSHFWQKRCVGAVARSNIGKPAAGVLSILFEIIIITTIVVTTTVTSSLRCWSLPPGPVMSACTEAPNTGWPPRSTLVMRKVIMVMVFGQSVMEQQCTP